MELVNELTTILQLYLLWGKPRCECFAQIVIAMFTSRTVNFSLLADQFVGSATKESNYKRISRLLRWIPITILTKIKLGSIVLHLLDLHETGVYLSMDRTCWDFGKRSINFLVIGVDFHGISIPVYFKLLPKKTKKEIPIPFKELML